MPDEVSASMDSAPGSAPSNDSAAVSANSAGAGEQLGQASTADANASATPESQIDAGWSLEDTPNEQASIPENDDDIEGLTTDPLLDQTKVPGLVTELRNARALAKESKRQAAEFKQQIATLEQYGGLEGVNQTMGLVNDLLTNPEQGIGNFLSSLYDKAYPSYEHLVNSVITANAAYAIEQLQQAGHLPANFTQPRAGSIDPATMAAIPEPLHNTAKNLTPDERAEFDELLTEQAQIGFLNRIEKLNRLDATQRQSAEQQWQHQVAQANYQGQEAVYKLASQYEQAHISELAKWKPLGPDSPDNQTIYGMAMSGAIAALSADPKFAQMDQDARKLLAEAPLRRLRNEGFAAEQDERKARQLAAQLNTRLGQVLRERVKLLDGVFRDARAYRESQRSEIPQRTEISGIGGSASRNGEPPRLTADGKVNPQWTDWMIAGLPGAR